MNYKFDCYFSRKYVLLIRNTKLRVYRLEYEHYEPNTLQPITATPVFIRDSKFGMNMTREAYIHVLLRSGIFTKSTYIAKLDDGIIRLMSARGFVLLNKDIFTDAFKNDDSDQKEKSRMANPFS